MSSRLDAEDPTQVLRILQFYVGGLKKENQFRCLQKSSFMNILSTCAARSNTDFDKFLADIDRTAKQQEYLLNSMERRAVEILREEWRVEIEVIRKCIDCYEFWTTSEEDTDFFTLVCKKPHLLVFIKNTKGDLRKWPAKVLSADIVSRMVVVEHFHSHLRWEYSFDDCYLYSMELETECSKNDAKVYERCYQEVKKYIQNVKVKFGRFVPAAGSKTISDFNRDLGEMYPNTIEPQATSSASEADNTVRSFHAKPSTSERTNKSMNWVLSSSPVCEGYELLTPASDSNSDYTFDLNLPRTSPPRIELPPTDIKIDYASSDSETESECYNGSDSVSVLAEQTQNRKRKKSNTSASLLETKSAFTVSKFDDSTQENEIVVLSDDEDQFVPDSSRSFTVNIGHSNAILDELGEVAVEISVWTEKLRILVEEERIIRAKLEEHGTSNTGGIFNETLNEFCVVKVKMSKCDKQLKRLSKQKDILIVKIANK